MSDKILQEMALELDLKIQSRLETANLIAKTRGFGKTNSRMVAFYMTHEMIHRMVDLRDNIELINSIDWPKFDGKPKHWIERYTSRFDEEKLTNKTKENCNGQGNKEAINRVNDRTRG